MTAFTYPEVGATRNAVLPAGYVHLRRSRVIGTGSTRFEEAARRLSSWEMHRRAGLRVEASPESAIEGAEARLRLGVGLLSIDAHVRVVYVIDEPRRSGFAYGTLPGHPESGEEAFVLDLDGDGAVTFTITAFSRASSLLARAGGPLTRAAQLRITHRYLGAV